MKDAVMQTKEEGMPGGFDQSELPRVTYGYLSVW